MKHYGLIKASRLEGEGRVNQVVELDLPPDATRKDLQHVLDTSCAAQGWSFIAFHPYGPVTGRHRFERQEAQQRIGRIVECGSGQPCEDEANIPNGAEDAQPCVFRGSRAAISRDCGHAFHAIAGSRFAVACGSGRRLHRVSPDRLGQELS